MVENGEPKNGIIPPTLEFNTLNPPVDWASRVARVFVPWADERMTAMTRAEYIEQMSQNKLLPKGMGMVEIFPSADPENCDWEPPDEFDETIGRLIGYDAPASNLIEMDTAYPADGVRCTWIPGDDGTKFVLTMTRFDRFGMTFHLDRSRGSDLRRLHTAITSRVRVFDNQLNPFLQIVGTVGNLLIPIQIHRSGAFFMQSLEKK